MTAQQPILTVTQLNRQVRAWLEHEMGVVCVSGELSNLSRPSSGHLYFSLKDASAQLRCVYFRQRSGRDEPMTLDNGQQVIAQGRLSLYEARGDYQLIVDSLKEAGQGDLFQKFEALKIKLAALGLFEASRKKTWPRFPLTIGVITSPTGAALRDILTTLKRRFPLARVIIYASEVQGQEAAQQLIGALRDANREKRADVLILARGGGSIEDLWAFNNEELAHAIALSSIPIVTGIGHETDTTIADFVSDLRAATPTAAAEAVAPNILDLMEGLQALEARLMASSMRLLEQKKWLLRHELQKINSPQVLINTHWQTLDYLKRHLLHGMQQLLAKRREQLHQTSRSLEAKNPLLLLQQANARLTYVEQALHQQMVRILHHLKQQLTSSLATLHAVSPLATLERGYAIVIHENHVLSTSEMVHPGDTITVRLAKGSLSAKIIHKESASC